jgi:sugar O-acyltransferase (sialic acid O-acetyltransferase NeuD family)
MGNDLKNIVIIGAGGFGREVADTIRAINKIEKKYELFGFADDDKSLKGSILNGLEVIGCEQELAVLAESKIIYAVAAVGSPKAKKAIVERYSSLVRWDNIIHPTAVISDYAALGVGNIFQAHTFLGPNTRIGSHCIINIGSSVGHDAVIEDYVSAMCLCDITGGVILGEGCYLGSGARVVPQRKIGAWAFLCAGAVVLNNVDAGEKMIGNPAKSKDK